MKISKYTDVLTYDDKSVIVFNCISKAFFFLEGSKSNITNKIVEHFNELCDEVKEKLYQKGFAVDNDIDEKDKLLKIRSLELNRPTYSLMILPTYMCNFSCWYCVQNHRNNDTAYDLIPKIKTHIEYYLTHNTIKKFEIAWFGGEPLLKYDDFMCNIIDYAKKICDSNGIYFFNTITTNGGLLTKNMIINMAKQNFIDYQITIDGPRDFHNKTRVMKNISSFDVILSNFKLLIKYNKKANLTLRFNYTSKNIENSNIVDQLNSIFELGERNKFEIMLVKVWQEDPQLINLPKLNEIKQKLMESGYVTVNPNISSEYNYCPAEKLHFNAIFHNGRVEKCQNIDPNETKGVLLENGQIHWTKENDLSLNSRCKTCDVLPICAGGCPAKRIDYNKNEVFDTILDYCKESLVTLKY